jgi:hemerythrin
MTQLIWTDDYLVGDGTIDNDHRGLFAAVNELEDAANTGAGVSEVKRIVVYLVRYVNEHFQREERLMHDCGYPDLAEHRDRHRRFSEKVYAIELICRTEPDTLDLGELVEFLRGWLVRHILGADRDFSPYLSGRSVAGSLADDADAEIFEADDFVSVDVNVPMGKIAAIQRCAEILSSGGSNADALMAIVERTQDLDVDQARKIAADFLK